MAAVYDSQYTGLQIDDAVAKVITAKNDGGIISGNGLTSTLTAYLTLNDAASTYLTQTNAANTYLTQSNAANTYLTQTNAASTYLTQTDAAANYINNTYIKIVDGCVNLYPINNGHREGIRIHPYNTWSDIQLLSDTSNGATSGITTNDWFFGNNNGNLYITKGGSASGAQMLSNVSNMWYLTGDIRYSGTRMALGMTDAPYIDGLLASYYSDASSVTGTLKITLPLNNGDCVMQILEVWVFDYNSRAGSQLVISGYSYINKDWHNYHCRVTGAYDKGCRMAFDGTHYCILLGTTSTVWNYPKVWFTKWMGGYSGRASMYNKGKPTISLITSESGYTISGSAT